MPARRLLLALAAPLLACATVEPGAPSPAFYTASAPSADEDYCAWYGDARDGVLYFGQSAFWSAFRRAGGRPNADLDRAGPRPIGRFDLRRERFLSPLETGEAGDRAGVWDVLAHPNGRVYYTTFFESAGWVDPKDGRGERWSEEGPGLNELALGPGGDVLASRYAARDGGDGGVAVLDPQGRVVVEHRLGPVPGYIVAPKTPAFDPASGEFWVTSDLLPIGQSAIRHDAFLLDRRGAERRRIERPEIQFAAFGPDGTGYRAEVDGHDLWLRVAPSKGPPAAERRIRLDDAFAVEYDFVQDIQPAPDDRVVVTRWSGWVHVVDAHGDARAVRLPSPQPEGLYYTAVLVGDRICATYCAGVTVVCHDAP